MPDPIINSFVKSLAISLGASYSFIKITYQDKKINILQQLAIVLLNLLLISIQVALKSVFPAFYRITFVFFLYCILLGKITRTNFTYSLLVAAISFSISYIASLISSMFIALIALPTYYTNISFSVPFLLIAILNIVVVYLFFKIKKFKNGFPFLNKYNNNEYFSIFMLVVCVIIIFMYIICSEFLDIPLHLLIISFIFISLIMIIILQKAFTLYHKQKLQTQALKDYEKELSETKQKLETAINEKQKLVKSNHEFYHRQEALNKKLDDLMKQQTSLNSSEFGEEYANVLDRINSLSNEYSIKTKSLPTLVKTNIVEIDDMLSYMQSECEKNNIEFILKVDCDLNFILENYISKSQLETLLGDLIRNAIIAIDHSSNDYKSIMVIFGIKDEAYELCIFDSGIPFEINTLLNLGLQPASTHTNEGGTGIGFITTFETINSCNASFIINENTNSNYSKSIEIKFDNKHEYIIISDRKEKITELNQSNRKIILK